MRVWIGCLLLLVAGCTSPPVDAPLPTADPVPSEPANDPTPPPEPSPPDDVTPPLENDTHVEPTHPPALNVTVLPVSGQAPLLVTVTINGSDPDGDVLRWSVLLNDTLQSNGTALPGEADIVMLAGHHNVTVRLTDGDTTAASYHAVVVHPALQTVEDRISGKSAGCLEGVPYDVTTMGYVEAAVEPTTRGQPFFVHFAGHSGLDAFLILDAAGNELERAMVGVNEIGPGALAVPTWTHAGTVPEAAEMLVFLACDNFDNSAPVNASPERFRYIAGAGAEADPIR